MAFEISKEHCCMLLFVCCFLLFLIWIDCPKGEGSIRAVMSSTPSELLGQEGFDQSTGPNPPQKEAQLTDEQEKNFQMLQEVEEKKANAQMKVQQVQMDEQKAQMDEQQAQMDAQQAQQAQQAQMGEQPSQEMEMEEDEFVGEDQEDQEDQEEQGAVPGDQQVLPSQMNLNQQQGMIMGYEDDILYASASSDYGMNIPISMQQDFAVLKSLGKLTPQIMQSLEAYNTASSISDSQVPQFDPTARGGLLPSQIGEPSQKGQVMGEADGERVEPGLPELQLGSPPGTPPGSPGGPSPGGPSAGGPSAGGPSAGGSVEVHMVYAEWCGHSQDAKGPYQQLMKETQGSNLKTQSGKSLSFLMTEEADEGMEQFKEAIQGFPTFMTVVKDAGGNVTTMEELEISDRNAETIKNAAMALSV